MQHVLESKRDVVGLIQNGRVRRYEISDRIGVMFTIGPAMENGYDRNGLKVEYAIHPNHATPSGALRGESSKEEIAAWKAAHAEARAVAVRLGFAKPRPAPCPTERSRRTDANALPTQSERIAAARDVDRDVHQAVGKVNGRGNGRGKAKRKPAKDGQRELGL